MALKAPALVRRPDRPGRVLVDGAGLALIAGVVAAAILGMFSKSPRVPRSYAGDGLSTATWVKGIIENGWVNSNPRLGAPFGQVHYDYPLGADNLHFVMIRIMAALSGDWVLVLNMFYVLSFSTATFTAYLTLRWITVGRLISGVIALVFAFLPYHFARGLEHLWLSSYFAVPLAVLVGFRVHSGLARRPLRSWRTICSALPWLACLAVVGSCGAYYAIFGLVLIVIAAVHGAVVRRSASPLWTGGLAVAGIGITMAANLFGALSYRRTNGVNQAVAQRQPIELDGYPLRIADLISPLRVSRLPGGEFVSEHLTLPLSTATGQYLGLIGVPCFVALALWVVSRSQSQEPDFARRLAALCVVAFLAVGTAGGLVWIGNLVEFTQIRVLSRASIYIAFLVLIWGGLSAGSVVGRWVGRSRRRVWCARAMAVLMVGLAWFDQIPDPVTRHPGAEAALAQDRDYFVGIEADLAPGDSVFVLPVRGYPEQPPTVASVDYDLFRPYLSTSTLRFSYGGILGREMEWQWALASAPADQLLVDLAATEFQGLLVDRYGYTDGGVGLVDAVAAASGVSARVDPSGRWAFFDLRASSAGIAQELGSEALADRKTALLQDPVSSFDGCYAAEPFETTTARWCSGDATLTLRSATEPVWARLSTRIYASADARVRLATSRSDSEFAIGPDLGEISIDVLVDPDGTEIELTTDAPAIDAAGTGRDLRMRLIDVQVDVLDRPVGS